MFKNSTWHQIQGHYILPPKKKFFPKILNYLASRFIEELLESAFKFLSCFFYSMIILFTNYVLQSPKSIKVLLDRMYLSQSKLLAYQPPKLGLECVSSTLINERHNAYAKVVG